MPLRDVLWEYPVGALAIIKRFSFFFTIFSGLLVGGLALLLIIGVQNTSQQRRILSGSLNYGLVSKLDVINPLEVGPSDAELMAAKLLYNSLVSIDDTGKMYPELAETWGISPDGRTYTFFLKKGIKWHDGFELTSKDVANTFDLVKSGDTDTVLGSIAKEVEVQVVSAYEISFTLKQVNAAFLELMTIPILPEHLYTNINYSRLVELGDSITPIGTGPYRYVKNVGDTTYFEENEGYFKGKPSIKSVSITVYSSYDLAEKALLDGEIQVLAPIDIGHLARLERVELVSDKILVKPFIQSNNLRLILFNVQQTTAPVTKELLFRQALAKAIDREKITELVSGSRAAFGPYDSSAYVYSQSVESINAFSQSEANSALEKLGWVYPYSGALYRAKQDQELKLTLTYLDNEVNRKVAQNIREQLDKIGVNLSLNGTTDDNMVQNVLPKKEFELLLFEIHTGIDPDQYGLWHSSQTTFPGLNLGGYNSSVVDALLEKGRLQSNRDKRLEIYEDFQKELVKDDVAIFLYHPAYYEAYFDIIERKLPTTIVDSSDRFSSIHTWKLLPGWRNWQTR